MARIRTIKPEFWVDEKVVQLTHAARLFFIGLWNFCDDYGRAEWKPGKLKMQIFPSPDDVFISVDSLLTELVNAGLVIHYEIDGAQYIQVAKWEKHQKVDRRSTTRLPKPPDYNDEPHRAPPNPTDGKGKGKGKGKGTNTVHWEGAFEDAWQARPRRAGSDPKQQARQAFHARVQEGWKPEAILEGVKRYAAFCDAQEMTGGQYVMQGKTFFGPECHFNNPWVVPDNVRRRAQPDAAGKDYGTSTGGNVVKGGGNG